MISDDSKRVDESLTSHNIDMLLNLIATKENSDQTMESSPIKFPLDYDWTQPAKSWWRYFKKQTEQNTAMCYTCGAVFNRGPKQSTTSLSHHLKMYHREQFILIQQAKDEDLRHNNSERLVFRPAAKRRLPTGELSGSQENGDYLSRKKSAFNLSLIESVRKTPELYDGRERQSDEKQADLWESVANKVGVPAQVAKKCWLSLSQRYRKEMKIAIRDNFSYQPKWPYFNDLSFLDEHFKTRSDARKQSDLPSNSTDYGGMQSYLNGSGVASNLLSNIFNVACAKSPMDEENGSTDSAFASTSEHSNADQELEQSDSQKQESTFLTIHKLFSATSNDQSNDPIGPQIASCQQKLAELPIKRSRSRKTAPARLQKSTVTQSLFDWLQDEDELFGKIVALRLRTLTVDQKRQMKILIEQMFERQERGLPLE